MISIFKKIGTALFLSSVLSVAGCLPANDLGALTEKESLQLVVTDSGLGGLSVVAEIARRAQATNSYQEVDVIFANALFQPEAGYNSLASRDEKIAVFNTALESMGERYSPDAILVACNTLSVLLPDCPATQGDTPIFGIVDAGVDIIVKDLESNPDSTTILFATQTTVDEGSHREGLLDREISEDRFVVQACPNLSWYIEREPDGFETELLISSFVSEAIEKRTDKSAPVSISFNCTHFGYSQELWEQEFQNQGVELAATLNPNLTMVDPLFPDEIAGRFETTTVNVSTVSMVDIPEISVNALYPVLQKTSTATAESFKNWQLVPGLFDWESALGKTKSSEVITPVESKPVVQ